MAKKQKTPEQLAVSKALKQPERRWKINRNCAWYFSKNWSAFTNYRGFSLGLLGENFPKVHGPEVPEDKLCMTLEFRPFKFLVFYKDKRRIWWGDKEWKRCLRNE